ncbi:major facilitator superfamily domain-containing protein 6-like isoform X2 [Xiphias gladius]|nr:major facilitator superfamily domain-containing protein 6-like isoform X2 [Xiphias gladius]XP_040011691.1 major facilitator superfamily domain-containing protein 6-like isoform X2 [Xiphias gladius]XP_040011699.1 major facilitator superfamily domain-containing protein 6-like isoform X2 [Xiphias gladius]XP_040011707.1 major facilitator superfamily domain-containing protein 6-like isoform X2 [Xiphias gladius]XP_040011715.1 major facilitator superfamily domain-containing protein 6-like isoform X
MKRNKQIDIKRALVLAGTFNFLCSCAKACLLPFLTLYFRQLGLTPAMTGIIMGTKHLISLVWSPVASLLSKHYNKRRVVINGSLVCSAAVALVLLIIPPSDVHTQSSNCNMSDLSSGPVQSLGDNLLMSSIGPETLSTRNRPKDFVSQPSVTFPAKTLSDTNSVPVMMSKTSLYQHGNDKSHPQLSQESLSVVVDNSLREPMINSSVVYHATRSLTTAVRNKRSNFNSVSEELQGEKKTEESSFYFLDNLKVMDTEHQLFFLILIIVSVLESVSAPLEWTADDGLYEYLDFADASDHYSSAGLWGLLGAACGVGGAGLLVSQLSCLIAGQTPRSAVHFYCYAVSAALALPVATYLPLYLNKKRDRANRLLKAMQLVRGSSRALLCAVTTLLVGVAGSAMDNFLLWQMQDHGGNELHMGLSLALGLLSQASFPLLAGRVSKLLSPGRLLAVGTASLGLQCFYYSFLWGPWAVLPAQILSCFSSGALWWAVKVQSEDVATPGAERSVRRVYSVLSLHLGSGLGSFSGGFVVQWFGLTWLFRGVAVGLMVWCVCLLLLRCKAPRQRRINYSRLLAANASEASDSESEQERDWLDKAMEADKSNNNYGRRINH